MTAIAGFDYPVGDEALEMIMAIPTYWVPFFRKSSPRVVIKCFIRVAVEPFTHMLHGPYV